MIRAKFGALEITGVLFFVLTVLLLWLAAKNLWTYTRLRNVDVTVVSSTLKIDALPPEDRGADPTLVYLLRLNLRAEDGSGRLLHWESDAGKAAYPEEAIDEIQLWGTGTRHRIQIVRGNARELRLSGLEESPELEAMVGSLIGAMLFGMVALAMVAGLAEESRFLRRFRWGKQMGIWMVFAGFGLVALLGWGLFTYFQVKKIWTWEQVEARRVEVAHVFDAAQLPVGVTLTPAGAARLVGAKYDVIEYTWRGAKVRGGVGRLGGVHDHLRSDRFRIDPYSRWELSDTLGWNSEFWAPFGILLFFGLAFTGAGLAIRSLLAPSILL